LARKRVLAESARKAGLTSTPVLVPEPVAAAAQFAAAHRSLAPGQALAVYDLGAGTFDVAVVARTTDGYEVLADGGLADFGGVDIDQALLDHVGAHAAQRDPGRWLTLLRPDSVAQRRTARSLRTDVMAAKEMLSHHQQTEVAMPEPFDDVLVTRAELEELVRPALARSVRVLADVIRAAGRTPASLAGIYLVGGSSRIPLAGTLIAQGLGVVPITLDQPETTVALGAQQSPNPTASPAAAPTPVPMPATVMVPTTAPEPVQPTAALREPPAAPVEAVAAQAKPPRALVAVAGALAAVSAVFALALFADWDVALDSRFDAIRLFGTVLAAAGYLGGAGLLLGKPTLGRSILSVAFVLHLIALGMVVTGWTSYTALQVAVPIMTLAVAYLPALTTGRGKRFPADIATAVLAMAVFALATGEIPAIVAAVVMAVLVLSPRPKAATAWRIVLVLVWIPIVVGLLGIGERYLGVLTIQTANYTISSGILPRFFNANWSNIAVALPALAVAIAMLLRRTPTTAPVVVPA
jgi:hypothetical protein